MLCLTRVLLFLFEVALKFELPSFCSFNTDSGAHHATYAYTRLPRCLQPSRRLSITVSTHAPPALPLPPVLCHAVPHVLPSCNRAERSWQTSKPWVPAASNWSLQLPIPRPPLASGFALGRSPCHGGCTPPKMDMQEMIRTNPQIQLSQGGCSHVGSLKLFKKPTFSTLSMYPVFMCDTRDLSD